MVKPLSRCYEQPLPELPLSCTLMARAFLTSSCENGVLWAKFREAVQNLYVIIQLEPTVKKTVEALVMGEVHSHWLESMLKSIFIYHPCVLIISPLKREEK